MSLVNSNSAFAEQLADAKNTLEMRVTMLVVLLAVQKTVEIQAIRSGKHFKGGKM